jgi:hypothetical protein
MKYVSKNEILLKGIKNYVISNYKQPQQYTKTLDNKLLYRYNLRDKTYYFKNVLKYIKKYNELNINYNIFSIIKLSVIINILYYN